jgi:DivIVA domain-containing protein
VDHDVVDRIRSASFALARKGYEKREVDRFLDELADWLETGGDDSARSDLVRRELERIGEQTTAILTEAHDAAEAMRTGAERQVRQQLADANIKAESMRSSAEEYAEEVREEADAYARRVRAEADGSAENARAEADSALAEARADAERSARQIIEEATRRRGEIEKVISDLEERRQAIVGELRRLASAAGIGADADSAPSEPESAPDEPDQEETTPLPIRGD